jgi:capsid protein
MYPNEAMQAHTSDRPSNGWQWLMELNIREIAAGLDLPFGVVWHMAGLGGPAARFEIAQANRVFMSFLNDVVDPMWHRPIVGRWLAIEIAEGRLPFTPLWFKFKTPRPKSITIDLGRDSKAGIAENAAGLQTATSWYADEDEDFEDATDQLAYEAWYRRNAIQSNAKYVAAGVTVEEIRMLGAAGNMMQSKGGSSTDNGQSGDDNASNS